MQLAGDVGEKKVGWNRVYRQAQDEIISIIEAEVALKNLSPI
jgi:hypothetical protein